MEVDNLKLQSILGRHGEQTFHCSGLGLFTHKGHNLLSFLDSPQYLESVATCENISVVMTTSDLASSPSLSGKILLICEDPRYDFYTLRNQLYQNFTDRKPSQICSTAVIHPTAYVSEFDVTIGSGTVIGPKVTVLPGVVMGNNCVIQPSAVLGSEGFEYKRTKFGIIAVYHDAGVVLGDRVEIGANTCIDKGIWNIDTKIGSDTKIDNLVHVAHSVTIGQRCLIVACSMIAGTVVIGDDVWVGPNANIAPQLVLGDGAFVSLGSVVTRGVGPGDWVSGNFAIPHKQFLKVLKTSLTV